MRADLSRLIVASMAVSVLSLAADAHAVEREGFLIGFSVGAGTLNCDDCDTLYGPASELHLGGMIGDKVALMFDGGGVAGDEDGETIYSTVSTAAVQYWVADNVWLKGGLGLGQLSCSGCDSETGLGILAGIGLELVQKTKFVLDLQGRVSTAGYDAGRVNNLSVQIGFNWY